MVEEHTNKGDTISNPHIHAHEPQPETAVLQTNQTGPPNHRTEPDTT